MNLLLKLKPLILATTRINRWVPIFRTFNTKPFLERDIAMILSKEITSAEVIKIILKAGKPLIEKVSFVSG